jgi:hypothetical protein
MPDLEPLDEALMRSIASSTAKLSTTVAGVIATQDEEITKLQAVSAANAETVRRLRRAFALAVAGLVLDMLLTVVAGLLYSNVAGNSHRIDVTQTATDRHLCGMYDLFLDSYNLASPGGIANPDAYEASFTQLEADATEAQCPHTTRGRN